MAVMSTPASPGPPSHLRAFLVGVRTPDLQATRVIQQVKNELTALVPSAEIVTLDSPTSTQRDEILHQLEAWKSGARQGVAHVFYYFGHGGRATFADIPEGGDRVTHCLACSPTSKNKDRLLFLRELSQHMGELHDSCGNVTVLLDSCYAGDFRDEERERSIVGSPRIWHYPSTPKWAKPALHTSVDTHLAAEGHPFIVRLMAASPRREAIAADLKVRGQLIKGVGLFTTLLLRELREAREAGDWWRMSWEMLAHGIRQRVISKIGNESQWISLGGPRERLLFSTERACRSSSVGCAAFEGRHWIRAGHLTGVEAGDEWALVGRRVDDDGHPVRLAEARVAEIESNLARLDPIELTDEGPDPVAAVLTGVADRMPVAIELTQTAWLRGAPKVRFVVSIGARQLRVIDGERRWGTVGYPICGSGFERAIELLEDRARVARLMKHVEELPASPTPSPIEWTVGVETEAVDSGARMEPGSAVWIRLHNTSKDGGNWFVSVVLVDAIGRPLLLNASQVDGIELDQEDTEYIGRRLGAARRGVVLDWPASVIEPGDGRVRLVMLASKRPIQLGHLARSLPVSDIEALLMQGLEPPQPKPSERTREGPRYRQAEIRPPGAQMVLSEGWDAQIFELVLRQPRAEGVEDGSHSSPK